MKLNQKPNVREAANFVMFYTFRVALNPILIVLVASVSCNELLSSNEIPPSNQSSRRDVTDLRLVPDFRSVKLRWTFKHGPSNQPAAFSISFCELTSWNSEIKCRRREQQVDRYQPADKAVIGGAPTETVHQLDPPTGPNYEAQVYDLRALTNYSFHVQVSRFVGEPAGEAARALGQRSSMARRLEAAVGQQAVEPPLRFVETKGFTAEATKCLANSSEVLVHTGRYFAGRISVEGTNDPRCHIVGNKSSEQTSYLFQIDNEACGSKTMDGNRIESMILVHENKDILTHNTARFLVLCNFQQKSFTLKASVSLPKVHSLLSPSRPAVITSLPGKPGRGPDQAPVMLGSMPGVYRSHNTSELPAPVRGQPDENTRRHTEAELEANVVERQPDRGFRLRQSKELGPSAVGGPSSNPPLGQATGERLPQPVEVQSKILFVERADSSRTGRQQLERHQVRRMQHKGNSVDLVTIASGSKPPRQLARDRDVDSEPLIMTNNHRVAADYLPLSLLQASPRSWGFPADLANYSIRYSAAELDDYPAGEPPTTGPSVQGRRSGRMRALVENDVASADHPRWKPADEWRVESRMGDMIGEASEQLGAELNATDATKPAPILSPTGQTFAQNITGYLLRWSLKALSNLARKSLESLVEPTEGMQNESQSSGALEQRAPVVPTVIVDAPSSFRPGAPASVMLSTERPRTSSQSVSRSLARHEPHDMRPRPDDRPSSVVPSPGELAAGPTVSGRQLDASTEQPPSRAAKELAETSAKANVTGRQMQQPTEYQWKDSAAQISTSNWPLYGVVLIALLTGSILLVLWLILWPGKRDETRPSLAAGTNTANLMYVGCAGSQPKSVFNSFTGYPTGSSGKQRSLAPGCPKSPSMISHSTRSTTVDETDCRNSEFVYTDHVLINTGQAYNGESFA